MFKLLRRTWAYLTAALTGKFNEAADPKVQLEQAIIESQEQHRRLKEQAANVIANQKQTELRLTRALEELEKLNANTQQAVMMADEATKRGDTAKALEYTNAAEAFANRLIAIEKEAEDLKQMSLQTAQASDQAKAAVAQNSAALQKKLAERQKLLSQLDQAKMQEQMNKAMASLSETVGQDVPTLDEVREKIEARYAKAKGRAELEGSTVESRMLEVEQASMNSEAQARLAEIRSKLGISSASAPAGEVQEGGAPSAGELVVVPQGGVVGEVLDELPVVALAVEEVDAPAGRVLVRHRRVAVAGGGQPLPERADVVDLEPQVVHARTARVRDPSLGRRRRRLVQREVHLVGADVHPARPGGSAPTAPHRELRERRLHEADHLVEVADDEVDVFESCRCHASDRKT
jgi:phage shock protein A